jgi:hypothetical protein
MRWNMYCAVVLTSAARFTPEEHVALTRCVRSLTPANAEQNRGFRADTHQDRDARCDMSAPGGARQRPAKPDWQIYIGKAWQAAQCGRLVA